MAQFVSAKELENETEDSAGILPSNLEKIKSTDVMTGGTDRARYLYYQLKISLKKAIRVDILVSFLMESGVKMLCGDLKAALDRGTEVRILTGNYLGITQPSALYLIRRELGDHVDLRFYSDKSRAFHPKAYIFHYEHSSDIYIGSSNLSRSALTSGIEWNYRFSSETDPANFKQFYNTFEDLFYHHSIVIDEAELRRYSRNWHKPALAKDLARYDEEDSATVPADLFEPRGAQIEALCALENSREEGASRALVQAATGVGKTYLAAFDSEKYERVLFVAHRDEILQQAANSFRNVRHSDDYGFFNGKQKDTNKSVVFASVSTLGRPEYLNERYFAKDYFGYLVIDEFHHAVNKQYRNILEYFTPQFMLGLTATPERLDGRDIYEICNYNVPYEISMKEAINKGLLVPFHYYGIYDETDYSSLHLVRGHYDEQDLTALYMGNLQRFDMIYKYYKKYRSQRALGFCCSRMHAEEMAKEFCTRGIPSVAVYSNAEGEFSERRDLAVSRLRKGEIRVIFCVDMFNEGLDIDSLDMVMFLRPTESPTVFLQQLGRGLRICRGKEYLTVLDFIGNYEKAGLVRTLLADERTSTTKSHPGGDKEIYPDDCLVDFDLRLIDLFQEMEKNTLPMKSRIREEFYRVKDQLNGKVPTRTELFTYIDDEVYEYCIRHSKENPFRKYLGFLEELGELSEKEKEVCAGIGREFLSVIETTDMQKVYKMPILYSFYNHGKFRLEVTDQDVLQAWKEFFGSGTNWKDFSTGITYEEYKKMTDRQHLSKAKSMPIRFLKASGKGFFIEKKGYALAIREDIRQCANNPAFISHMKDILEYRTMEYYRRRYTDSSSR